MAATSPLLPPDELTNVGDDIVHLARLALSGREQDIQTYVQRLARRYGRLKPELGQRLIGLLREAPRRDAPLRSASGAPAPVDLDSRLPLVRHDVASLEIQPIFGASVHDRLIAIRDERQHLARLTRAGLAPSRTGLFVGPPGVGKTLAARWLASELALPLLVLDLSAVMSSLLGRTGVNVRRVLDYAKAAPCVLLLDELDAVAKRRDDATEIGELKRLVTVLLQEIDDWPETSLLLAATNHPDLLDPAVWRRFDNVVNFTLPDHASIMLSLAQLLSSEPIDVELLTGLAQTLEGFSFSDVERLILNVKRRAVISDTTVTEQLEIALASRLRDLPTQKRIDVAVGLVLDRGLSQRRAHDLTGVSRDTIRKRIRSHSE